MLKRQYDIWKLLQRVLKTFMVTSELTCVPNNICKYQRNMRTDFLIIRIDSSKNGSAMPVFTNTQISSPVKYRKVYTNTMPLLYKQVRN